MEEIARADYIHKGICDHGQDCCPHEVEGVLIPSQGKVLGGSKEIVVHGDSATHNCPHCGIGRVVSSSTGIIVRGRQIARVGDIVKYPSGEGIIQPYGYKLFGK